MPKGSKLLPKKVCTAHQKNIICTEKKHFLLKKNIFTEKIASVLQK
jgi:hypothetical protein